MKAFTTFQPPVLTVIDNQKYVCPGWIKVPMKTTLKEVNKAWTKLRPKGAVDEVEHSGVTINYKVKSSKGDKEYTVTYNGNWSCDCPGYGFRRKCRHITELKEKQKV